MLEINAHLASQNFLALYADLCEIFLEQSVMTNYRLCRIDMPNIGKKRCRHGFRVINIIPSGGEQPQISQQWSVKEIHVGRVFLGQTARDAPGTPKTPRLPHSAGVESFQGTGPPDGVQVLQAKVHTRVG